MGRKINLKVLIPLLIFIIFSIVFYYPVLFGEIPFNGNLLVSLWSPLNFLKWAEFPAGVPFKFMGVDEVREFYPLLDFTYDSFRSGTIPLWNPYNFSGYSHIGNWASAVFYPINLSMFVLSKTWVLILLKLSVAVLAGFFTYIYLQTLKINELPSYFGALAFAFSATMQIWTTEIWQSAHAFLWLPLVLFSIEKLIRERKIEFTILIGISIAMSIMAGYIQPTIYLLILSSLYAVFRVITERKYEIGTIVNLGLGFTLGITLSAVQLLPAVEAYLLSPRSQVSLHDLNVSFLLPIGNIITLFVPDFFGNIVTQNWFITRPGQYYENMIYLGIIPLVLGSLSVWIKKYRRYVFFFAATSLISLSLIFDLPTSRLIYDFSIPFLSSAIPIRVIFVASFAISVLSAIGLEWWLTEKDKRETILGILPLSVIFIGISFFVYYSFSNNLKFNSFPDSWYFISTRNFVIPAAFAIGSIFVLLVGQYFLKIKKYLGIILILFLFSSSFLFVHKYISFSDRKFLYPSHPLVEFVKDNQGLYRYWGYGSAALPNNFATVYKIYSPEGYDPVNIGYYNELLSSSRGGRYEGAFSRSDALLYAVTEFPFKDINDTRYRIMDILGVKYIGFEKGEFSKIEQARLDFSRYEKIWDKDNFMVFENKKVFPRVYLADRFVLRTDKEDAIQTIYDKNINLKETVIVENLLSFEENKASGNAKILSYARNKITIETETEDTKILVLSDAFYPGWKASVNPSTGSTSSPQAGSEQMVESKIIRINHAFRGLVIPRGKSHVIFSYDPLSFKLGLILTVGSILTSVLIYLRSRRNVN